MERNIAIHIPMEVPHKILELKPDLPATLFYERKGLTHINEKLFDTLSDVGAIRFKKDGQIYRSVNSIIEQLAAHKLEVNPIILQWIFDALIEISIRNKFSTHEEQIMNLKRKVDEQNQAIVELNKENNFLTFQCTKLGKYVRLYSKESSEKEKIFKEIEEKNENLHDAIENEVADLDNLNKELVREEAILAKTDLIERTRKVKKKHETCLLRSHVSHGYLDDLPLYTWQVISTQLVDSRIHESWNIFKDKLNHKKIDLLVSILVAIKVLSEDAMCKLLASLDA